MKTVLYMAAGAGAAAGAVALTPVIAGAAGFTAGGIAAGSVAAKMMSAAAIANGGGVVTGGTVAVLQSVGAAGVSAATGLLATGAGAAVGYVARLFS